MTGYSTISQGGADMPRRRGTRNPKAGGGQASMLSSCINLLNTIVGAGTLAMPSAMSHMGVMLGIIIIVWSAFTSAFGLYLQSRCARYLDRGHSSFFALSQLTYPNAAVVFDAAIAVKCFGVGVSYLIIIGDLMPGVMRGFDSRVDDYAFLVDRNFWITAFMLLIIPLAFLRRLDSLKYTSIIALVSIGYLIIIVVYHFASDHPVDRGDVRIITWAGPMALLSSLPVVIFAYTCHQNMFSILNEIKDDSPSSILGVISASIGSAAGIYVLVAITGYLTFGDKVIGNIVSMYDPNIASTIAKAAIVVLVTFSVPLQIHPCRASLDAVLKWRPNRSSRSGSSPGRASSPPGPGLPTPASSAVQTDSHGSPVSNMSDLRFSILTCIIIALSYSTALTVSSLDSVLAYVGATGSTSISFILPGLFYYKISAPDSPHHQRLIKEDDDADTVGGVLSGNGANGIEDEDDENSSATSGLLGGVSRIWRGRSQWRFDFEHLEPQMLRKMALGLAVYGMGIMAICLTMNIVKATK